MSVPPQALISRSLRAFFSSCAAISSRKALSRERFGSWGKATEQGAGPWSCGDAGERMAEWQQSAVALAQQPSSLPNLQPHHRQYALPLHHLPLIYNSSGNLLSPACIDRQSPLKQSTRLIRPCPMLYSKHSLPEVWVWDGEWG